MEAPERVPGVYRLPVPGEIIALEFGVHLRAETVASDRFRAEVTAGDMPTNTVMLDADVIKGELLVRGPKPGDRFAPQAMGGRTKLVADYLRDERVPRHRRALERPGRRGQFDGGARRR